MALFKNSSELTKRRWKSFKNNKRGYYSLIIFTILFTVTLFAEFIANDKPILIKYEDKFYTPIFSFYAETEFGGDYETEADYKDEYIEELINKKGWIIWPPIRYSYSTINYNLPSPAPSPPTSENLLGTDDRGRDVAARIIYGFRISVLFGITLTIFSSIIGIIAGALQGYLGGWVDLFFQRFIEIWSSVPQLFLLIIMASIVTPSFWWLFIIMLLFSWMSLVGVVRAECLRTRNMDYIKAAKSMGVSKRTILFRHILPNSIVSTITYLPFILNGSITTLTALDFLGFGLPPGSPSLGELLSQGKSNMNAPWLGLSGFIIIASMLSMLIFTGEAVRDAFDPRK